MTSTSASPFRHWTIAVWGTLGDVFPYLRLSHHLRHQGHTVDFLAPRALSAPIADAGFTVLPIGQPQACEQELSNPKLWQPQHSLAVIWAGLKLVDQHLCDWARAVKGTMPPVLLTPPALLPAAEIARVHRPDLKIIGAYLAPHALRTCYGPVQIGPHTLPAWLPPALKRRTWEKIDRSIVDPQVLARLNVLRRKHSLPPASHFVEHMLSIPDTSIALFPSWYAPVRRDWPTPLTLTDFPLDDVTPSASQALPSDLMRFLALGRTENKPVVVFTPGTGQRHALAYFKRALECVQSLGCRALFLSKSESNIPEGLPPEVLWQAYVPLPPLLPHVCAIVHHGGIGTTAEALRAGVPQLVVPKAFDQFDNGARIARLGVGESLPTSSGEVPPLSDALKRILRSDAVGHRAKAVAAKFRAQPDWSQALQNLISA